MAVQTAECSHYCYCLPGKREGSTIVPRAALPKYLPEKEITKFFTLSLKGGG